MPLIGEPVEPDPVSTGVGSRSLHFHPLALLCPQSAAGRIFPLEDRGMLFIFAAGLASVLMSFTCNALADVAQPVEEVLVTATLRPLPPEQVPGSLTVLDAGTLNAPG